LGLLLSNKPTVLPLRSAKRGSAAIRSDDVRAFPSGLKIIIVSPCSVRWNSLTLLSADSLSSKSILTGIFPRCPMLTGNTSFTYRNQKKFSTGDYGSGAKTSLGCALITASAGGYLD
jgi:hypothetical protein